MDNCKIKIGAIVIHKEYGHGTIYKITDKNVFVAFEKKKRRFPYLEAFENGDLVIKEKEEHVVPPPDYPDIVPIHPDWTDEDYERHITEDLEKAKKYTEWPDI